MAREQIMRAEGLRLTTGRAEVQEFEWNALER
jgi:hypothetical protein